MLTERRTKIQRGRRLTRYSRGSSGCARLEFAAPVRAESPLYPPSSRRRRRSLSAPTLAALGAARRSGRSPCSSGSLSRGRRSELAAGTRGRGRRRGGADAGTRPSPSSTACSTKQSGAAGRRSPRRPRRTRSQRTSSRWSRTGTAPSRPPQRAGDGFGPLRGFRRLRARVFGAEVLPRVAVSNAALEYALDQIADGHGPEPAERGARAQRAADPGRPRATGRRLDRDAAAETIVRALGQLERTRGATALPVSVARARGDRADARRRRGPRAPRVSRPVIVRAARAELPPAPLAPRASFSGFREDGSTRSRSQVLPRTRTSVCSRDRSVVPAGCRVCRVRRVGSGRPCPRRTRGERSAGCSRDPSRCDPPDESRRVADDRARGAEALDRRCARAGHRSPHVVVQDVLLGNRRPHHESAARREGARRHSGRAWRDLLAQRRDR